MKLHLPKLLFTAVIAAVCCVQQANAVDYSVYTSTAITDPETSEVITPAYGYDIVQWSGGHSNANGLCYGNYYYATYDASTQSMVKGDVYEQTSTNGNAYREVLSIGDGYDNYNTILLDIASPVNNETDGEVYYDINGVRITGLIVTSDSKVNTLKANNRSSNRSMTIGKAGGATGYTTIAKDFSLNMNFNSLTFVGTQVWNIESGKTFTIMDAGSQTINNGASLTMNGGTVKLQSTLTNNGTLTINGNLNVNKTIVNNGTISFGTDGKIILDDLRGFENSGFGNVNYDAASNGVQSIETSFTIEKGTATEKISSVWYNGAEKTLTNGVMTQSADVYVVVADEVTAGGAGPTPGTDDVFGFAVGEKGTLKIAGDTSRRSASDILVTTEGSGTMVLGTRADVLAGQSLAFEGALSLAAGGTLNFGMVKGAQSYMSNLSSLVFDGGTLNFNAVGSEIKNVTVTSNGGTFNVQDFINLDERPARIIFKGDTTLNGNLTYNTTYKSLTTVEHLTGTGNFTINTGDQTDSGANVIISSMAGYSGTLVLNGRFNSTTNSETGETTKTAKNRVVVTATLDSDYTLNANQVQLNDAVAAELILTGSGTYNLGNAKTMTSGVRLADAWEGSVKVTGTVSGSGDSATLNRYDILDLDVLEDLDTTEKGTVTLSGVKGYFQAANNPGEDHTFSADIVLENYVLGETSHSALQINDGYSIEDTTTSYTDNRHTVIEGSISGYGDLEYAKKSSDAKYLVQGDVSNWHGTLKATKNVLYLVTGGEATSWDAAIIDKQGTNGVGTIHLSVDNSGKTTTFAKEVSVSSLTVTDGSTAKFTATDETSGDSKLSVSGNITLGKGAALDVTGSITLDANNISLADGITFDSTDAVTLVTVTGGTLTVNNMATWTGSSYEIDGKSYTTSLSVVDNNLKLNFTADSLDTLDVYVTMDGTGYADGKLTLAMVDANGNLIDTAADNYNVIGLYGGAEWDAIRELITDGANPIAITLQGAEGFTIVGSGDTNADPEVGAGNVSFYGKYYGEAGGTVGTAGSYNPNYIPEPASATLGLAALMMLASRRRRKA